MTTLCTQIGQYNPWRDGLRHSFVIIALTSVHVETARGDFFYTGHRNSNITRIDERTGEAIQIFATKLGDGFSDFRGMTLGPDGLLYVSGRDNFPSQFGTWGVFRFDPNEGRYIDTFIQTGPLNWISFDSDGDLYAVDSWSDSLVQYDGTRGTVVRTVLAGSDFQYGVGTFVLGNHGDVFASTDASKFARYDLDTGQRIGPVTDLEQLGLSGYGFDQMAFGPDGRLYAAYNYRFRDAVRDGGVITFDSATGAMLEIVLDDLPAFGAANGGTLGLAFGPDGDLFVGSQHADAILRFDRLSLQRIQEIPIAGLAHSATFIVFLPVPEPRPLVLVMTGLAILVRTRKCPLGQR